MSDRKATDILVSIEAKLESLINYQKSQDLNNKILSNKLNNLLSMLNTSSTNIDVQTKPPAAHQIKIEAADLAPNKNIKIYSDNNIPVDPSPNGVRRTSRPESENNKFTPPSNQSDNIKEDNFINYPEIKEEKFIPPKLSETRNAQITQRVIDKNNKSIFLAEVEIKSIKDDSLVAKTRTNSLGKWIATLPVGDYKVGIKKRETSGKQKIEIFQDLNIDGNKTLIELNDLIVK